MAAPLGLVEKSSIDWATLLQRVQLQVSVSWQLELSAETWQLDLLSPFWRVYVNDRPGAYIVFGDEQISLAPDYLYIIPAWVRFQTGTARPVRQDFIHFYLTGFPPPLLHQLFDRPCALPLITPLDVLVERWRDALQSESTPGLAEFSWSYALAHAALAQCVAELWAAKGRESEDWLGESTLVWPALERIETHLAQPPTNAELAALCHLSTDYFIRLFRRAVGLTPAQYGLERRIAAAAHRLINSRQTIEEISAATGFTDRFHFSKVFRKRLHIPPVAYRKMHQYGN